MPHFVATVTTSWTPEQAFAYLADFSNAAEWDPGTAEAARLDDGEVGVGSAFDLVVVAGGRRIRMRYRVTEYAPGRVTFVGRTGTLESCDTIAVTARGGITEVTYDARLSFRGLLRVADPLLDRTFHRIADQGLDGLARRLASDP